MERCGLSELSLAAAAAGLVAVAMPVRPNPVQAMARRPSSP